MELFSGGTTVAADAEELALRAEDVAEPGRRHGPNMAVPDGLTDEQLVGADAAHAGGDEGVPAGIMVAVDGPNHLGVARLFRAVGLTHPREAERDRRTSSCPSPHTFLYVPRQLVDGEAETGHAARPIRTTRLC